MSLFGGRRSRIAVHQQIKFGLIIGIESLGQRKLRVGWRVGRYRHGFIQGTDCLSERRD